MVPIRGLLPGVDAGPVLGLETLAAAAVLSAAFKFSGVDSGVGETESSLDV